MNSEENIKSPLNINTNNENELIDANLKQNKRCWRLSKWQMIRIGIVLLLLIGIALNTFIGFALPSDDVDCLKDYFFIITANVNKYFDTHPKGRAALLIISSLGIDLMVFICFFHWAIYSTSWRLIMSLFSFYTFRAAIQFIFAMQFPEGYLWIYPGFPSLFVSYLKTRDFFFSGHVGFPVILALEWNRIKIYYMQVICYVICLLEFITMVFLRGHYSIDLVSGLVFSHYFFVIIEPLAKIVDNWKYMNMTEKNRLPQVEPITNVNVNGLMKQDDYLKV